MTKITAEHLARSAIVYIRQSTPQQIIEHKESTNRQYGLVDRAVALGWPADRVVVIDEDQGCQVRALLLQGTAQRAECRDGIFRFAVLGRIVGPRAVADDLVHQHQVPPALLAMRQ